ncbi:MAG TPA: YihY/virulence factor BrkB family protein [Chryseosolibacter sp.]|nr:YihY/virulence factor BrkB family protein [Chryseosolibacter sp.]
MPSGKINDIARLIKDAFYLFRQTDPLILSSSTAFFATFSLSPIFLLLVNLFGLYFTSDKIANKMFGMLASTVGVKAANEIESIVENFMAFETNVWMTIAGALFFVFVSTTLLSIVKANIHKLWRIRKVYPSVRQQFRERTTFAALIVMTGLFFLISLTLDTILAISLDYLQTIVPAFGIAIIRFLNAIFSVVTITIWFTVIFRVLPEARVEWEVAFNGAFLTAVLYYIGKFALGKFLINAQIASIFGASASFAILLLFIFYCSFIIYFGAAFTYIYARFSSKEICAGKYSHAYEEKIIYSDQQSGA